VKVRRLHPWPATVEEAAVIQDRLRPLVRLTAALPAPVRTAAGVDVAYSTGSERLVAGVAVLDTETLETVDTAIAPGTVSFPYATGFLAFRELPALVAALERLTTTPDLLVCDGQGFAHPRRFGLACHLGVLTDVPSIGVAKTPLGHYDPPAPGRGSSTDLLDGAEVIGRALRTQDNVKPVFVSVGHKIDLDAACEHVLRLPETTRRADQLVRNALVP
jgi:deoxyribonuclease V